MQFASSIHAVEPAERDDARKNDGRTGLAHRLMMRVGAAGLRDEIARLGAKFILIFIAASAAASASGSP